MDAFKADLEDEFTVHRSGRPEPLHGVAADPAVQLQDLRIIEAGVGLGEAHQLRWILVIPEPEGVVGEQVGSPTAAGLGIQQHGVEGHRLQLVLPPVAAAAAGEIGGVQAFQHQPLSPLSDGLLTFGIQRCPALQGPAVAGGQAPALGMADLLERRHELLSASPQGLIADVCTVQLQEVVGDEAHRALPFQGVAHRFASQPSLQCVEPQWNGGTLLPADDLAIQCGSIRQGTAHRHQFGETVIHQFLAPAPEVHPCAAMDQLAPDAIPFPLQQPMLRWLSGQPSGIQGAGQEERVGGGTAAVLVRSGRGSETGEGLSRWFEPPHQALHHQAFLERKGLGHCTADQPLGNADSEATGEQFVDDEMQWLRHLTPEP